MKKTKNLVAKISYGLSSAIFIASTSLTQVFANNDTSPESVINKVTGGPTNGEKNIFQPLIDMFLSAGMSAYGLVKVVAIILAILCFIVALIFYLASKNSTKKSENKDWAIGILIAVGVICMAGSIISGIAEAGSGI